MVICLISFARRFNRPARCWCVLFLELDGEADHAHLLIAYQPKLAINVMVNNVKSAPSRRIRILNTPMPRQINWAVLWSRSNFACSTGYATNETLREYV